MAHRNYRCQVQSIQWLGSEADGLTAIVRFIPQAAFDYEPGQFVSLQVPNKDAPNEMLWRAYSLALPAEMAKKHGYELCIKKAPNGQTGAYLEKLKAGDWIQLRASYGEFTLRTKAGRGVCLIGTGTGVAPLRAIALSEKFADTDILFGMAIIGYRTFDEIPYAGDFERAGLATTYAISNDQGHKLEFPFFGGRVTDVMKRLKSDFPWQDTDFYLCGNGYMIRDVLVLLKSHGVNDSAIIAEAFLPASKQTSEAA